MRLVVAALAALVLAAPALASERRPTLSELEGEVICPTCKTTLDQSNSPIASRMRVFIRERIAAGDTKSEIKDALVDEFGESVLASPPARGFNLLAWVLPLAGVVGGALLLAFAARRWASAREPERAPEGAPLDPALERRVDEELARFDG
jgi:cytochrome c-type biogenesis protein CcmH